jgi:hypothetical protein
MSEEILYRRGTTLVRRQILEPGEALPWHRDPYHRVAVVLRGSTLLIEHRDGSPGERISVTSGEVGWDEPYLEIHRGVNVGQTTYEEVTVFFLDRPDAVPQPEVE